MKRWSPALTLLLLALLPVGTARAHADLVKASPDFNANLDRAPVQVELFFTEPLESGFSTIQVLDSSGARVDNDDARVDESNPTRLTVSMRSLADGIYTVSWKVLSLVDNHITAGAYPFAVGDVDPDALAAAGAGQSTQISAGEVIFRWLTYLSGAVLIGGGLFRLLVWRPVSETRDDHERPRPAWHILAGLSLVIMVSANVLGLVFQIGQLLEQGIAAPWSPAGAKLLFTTRYGLFWILRFVIALAAARWCLKPRTTRELWLGMGLTAAIPLTFSLSSHAAAEPQPWLPISADFLHLIAASVWVGGLVYFVFAQNHMRKIEPRLATQITADLIPRFSGIAAISVGLLLATGLYSAVLRVGSWAGLTATLYGRILSVKTILALPMLMLGALNLLVTSKSMRTAAGQSGGGDPTLVGRFRWLITGEALFGIIILLVVGVFTAVPPVQAAGTESTLRESVSSDDLEIGIVVEPGRVGLNTFEVTLQNSDGPVQGVREVAIEFLPTTVDIPASTARLDEIGEGTYAIEGAFLSLPDEWQLQVSIRRDNQFDTFANFPMAIGVRRGQSFPWNQLTGLLLLAGAALFFYALQSFELPKKTEWLARRLPALILVVAAGWVYFLPIEAGERYVNPIAPNVDSVAQGEALYRVNCIACHGPTGRGDGPVGLTLNPPPANLALHTAPGVHPDGQLFEWISFGFPDVVVMPAFQDSLSVNERRHLVNYIRTFQALVSGNL